MFSSSNKGKIYTKLYQTAEKSKLGGTYPAQKEKDKDKVAKDKKKEKKKSRTPTISKKSKREESSSSEDEDNSSSDTTSSDSEEEGWSDASSDSDAVESEEEIMIEKRIRRSPTTGNGGDKKDGGAGQEKIALSLEALDVNRGGPSVGGLLRDRKEERRASTADDMKPDAGSELIDSEDGVSPVYGGVRRAGHNKIKSRIKLTTDSDEEDFDEEFMFAPIMLSLSSKSLAQDADAPRGSVVRSKEEIEELRKRVQVANEILDKRESSTIYGRMKPLKKSSLETIKDDEAVPTKMVASDGIASSVKSARSASAPKAPSRRRTKSRSPRNSAKVRKGSSIRRQRKEGDGRISVRLHKTFPSQRKVRFHVTIPNRQYDPFAIFSIPITVHIRNETSAEVRAVKVLVAVSSKTPRLKAEETERDKYATKVHVRETKVKLKKDRWKDTIKYSFPLLEKKVLEELDKYTFQLWVECVIHRHNGIKAKIPLTLKNSEKRGGGGDKRDKK